MLNVYKSSTPFEVYEEEHAQNVVAYQHARIEWNQAKISRRYYTIRNDVLPDIIKSRYEKAKNNLFATRKLCKYEYSAKYRMLREEKNKQSCFYAAKIMLMKDACAKRAEKEKKIAESKLREAQILYDKAKNNLFATRKLCKYEYSAKYRMLREEKNKQSCFYAAKIMLMKDACAKKAEKEKKIAESKLREAQILYDKACRDHYLVKSKYYSEYETEYITGRATIWHALDMPNDVKNIILTYAYY